MKDEGNKLIDCNLYDFLEAWAVKKEKVEIIYMEDSKQKVLTEEFIVDLFVKEHQEFLKTESGHILPLVNIYSVNGILFQKYCK